MRKMCNECKHFRYSAQTVPYVCMLNHIPFCYDCKDFEEASAINDNTAEAAKPLCGVNLYDVIKDMPDGVEKDIICYTFTGINTRGGQYMQKKKKIFLSVPMKGRTKENIEKSLNKMKDITIIALNTLDVEFIHTAVEEKPPYNANSEALWYLGKSIQKLSEADMLVCVDTPYWMESNGCRTERNVFDDYVASKTIGGFFPIIELPLCLVMDQEEYDELHKKHLEEERPKEECSCSPGRLGTIN